MGGIRQFLYNSFQLHRHVCQLVWFHFVALVDEELNFRLFENKYACAPFPLLPYNLPICDLHASWEVPINTDHQVRNPHFYLKHAHRHFEGQQKTCTHMRIPCSKCFVSISSLRFHISGITLSLNSTSFSSSGVLRAQLPRETFQLEGNVTCSQSFFRMAQSGAR